MSSSFEEAPLFLLLRFLIDMEYQGLEDVI